MLAKRWATRGALLLIASFEIGAWAGQITAASAPPSTTPATAPAMAATVAATAPAPTGLQLMLDASDMEWKVIGPLVNQLVNARRVLETAGVKDRVVDPFGLFGNDSFAGPSQSARGGLGISEGFTGWGVGTSKPATEPSTQGMLVPQADVPNATTAGTAGVEATLAMALNDLQAAAADPKVTDAALRNKLAVFRLARARAQSAVDRANESLRRVLTSRQEGWMVAMGYLD